MNAKLSPQAFSLCKHLVMTRPDCDVLAHNIERNYALSVTQFSLFSITPASNQVALQQAHAAVHAGQYAWVVFASPEAIKHWFAINTTLAWPSSARIALVGQGSLAMLQSIFTMCHTPMPAVLVPHTEQEQGSDGLMQLLNQHMLSSPFSVTMPKNHARVLFVRAQSGREALLDYFQQRGMTCDVVASYHRQARALNESKTHQTLLNLLAQAKTAWWVSSSEALRHLCDYLKNMPSSQAPTCWQQLQQAHWLLPHQRIVQAAAHYGLKNISKIAPGEQGLLAWLQSHHERAD